MTPSPVVGNRSGFVLVTGGGVRVGAQIARVLAQAGFGVIVHYNRSAQHAEDVCQDIISKGGQAVALQADLASAPDWADLLDSLHAQHGIVGIVNNASMFEDDGLETFQRADLRVNLDVNFAEPLALCQWLKSALPEAERGFVINILDQKIHNTNTDYFSYTMSKLALANATATLAMAMAPNIRVNSVSPGLLLPSGPQSMQNFERVHSQTVLGYGATPDDVAEAVLYLALAQAVTGVDLPVDGGQRMVKSDRDVMFV